MFKNIIFSFLFIFSWSLELELENGIGRFCALLKLKLTPIGSDEFR